MNINGKRILLLSAYDAASHRAWRERLKQLLPEYQWTQLVLAPRNFNWKIRGNSLIWAHSEGELLRRPYDLILATSMVDLSSLKGFVPQLATIPTIVYFHENQFSYPQGQHRKDNIEHQLVPLYAALSSDHIVFNSEFNRSSFLKGARSLLKKLPDKLPTSILKKLESAEVIGVPLSNAMNKNELPEELEQNQHKEFNLLWNHRWEYDKGPDLLLEVAEQIKRQKLPVRFHIVGESFRNKPDAFAKINDLLRKHEQELGMSAAEFGYISVAEKYQDLLRRCDAVLSTADHDFQGLAIQEACLQGCTPLAPDDLVYPEYLDAEFLYRKTNSNAETAAEVIKRLRNWITSKQSGGDLPKAELKNFSDEVLAKKYRELFEQLS